MHLKRLAVAAVVLPALYYYVMHLQPQYYLYLVAAVSTAALAEFYAMAGVGGLLGYAGLAWGAALLFIHFYAGKYFVDFIAVASVSMMTIRLFSSRIAHGSIMDTTMAVFGLIYVPVLLSFQLNIVRQGPALVIMLFAAVWGSDSLALYMGKAFGKRKLYVEISPNKTVEGAVGSFIGGLLGVLAVKFALLQSIPLLKAVVIALVISLSAIIGDLVESMFKRDAGIKDSGSLLPGHGGFLDKIDSFVFAGPAFYWACLFLGIIR